MVFKKVIREEVTVRVPKIGRRATGMLVDDLGTILVGQQCVLKSNSFIYPKYCEFRRVGKVSELACSKCVLSNKNLQDYINSLTEVD